MSIEQDCYAVVMAGGKGERFWPQSRMSRPKQLLRLIGNLTLIEQTVERLTPLVPKQNILVVTNQDYVAPMRALLNDLPAENIIGEPVGRDTAPCVALAAGIVRARTAASDAVMLLLPADHVIRDTDGMLRILGDCGEMARQRDSIVTIGVNPSYASTGYGYIRCGDEVAADGLSTRFFQSMGFSEKPSPEVAEKFLGEKSYKWNSGMFIWTVDAIMRALRQCVPDLAVMADRFEQASRDGTVEATLKQEYSRCDKISIDYAVMEKIDNVLVAECTFDWDDVGSWNALRNQIRPSSNNNVVRGLFEGINVHDCIVVGDAQHLITAVDVDNLIIVNTGDATLVCNAKSAQRVKELVHLIGEKPELSKFL